MNLQNTFYLTTIIMEVMAIVLLVALVILVFFMMKKLGDLSNNVSQRLDSVGNIIDNPSALASDIAVNAGAALIGGAVGQAKKIFNRR